MVIVAFKPGEKEISKYEELDQYDYGQILRIQGLNLPQAVEIHFALQKTGGTSKTLLKYQGWRDRCTDSGQHAGK